MSALPHNVSKAQVLIADESPLVVANLKILLREMGFSDRLVCVAKDRSNVISSLRKYSIDLFICDAHFCQNAAGASILTEAKERNLISPSCILFILTSETDSEHLRTIVDAGADDYATKPYSLFGLKRQLKSVCQKKLSLKSLYQLDKTKSTKEIEEKFTHFCQLVPEQTEEIDKIKGDYYISINDYRLALVHFKKSSLKYSMPWPYVGLATCLIQLGDYGRAESYLNETIDSFGTSSPKILDTLAHVRLLKGNVEGAILCLNKADDIAKGNRDRLRCLTTLYESSNIIDRAFQASQLVAQLAYQGQKEQVSEQIDTLRLQVQLESSGSLWDSSLIEKQARAIEKTARFDNDKLSLILLKAHITLLNKDHRTLRSLFSALLKGLDRLDASNCWYLLNLLFWAHDDYWFKRVAAHYNFLIGSNKKTRLIDVCEILRRDSLVKQLEKRQELLETALSEVRQSKTDSTYKAVLSAIELTANRPYCVPSALLAIELMSEHFPKDVPRQSLRKVITNSEQLIAYSISLRNSDKEKTLSLLKQVKQKFNQLVSVTE